MVQIHPDPPTGCQGAIAQLGERLLCKQEVTGSIPVSSTTEWQKALASRAGGGVEVVLPDLVASVLLRGCWAVL